MATRLLARGWQKWSRMSTESIDEVWTVEHRGKWKGALWIPVEFFGDKAKADVSAKYSEVMYPNSEYRVRRWVAAETPQKGQS